MTVAQGKRGADAADASADVIALTVGEVLAHQATVAGESPFLVDPESGQALDYATVNERAGRLGTGVGAASVAQGASVAFALHNGVDAAVAVLGILTGGFRAVAINLVAGEEAIAYALGHSEARLIVVDAQSRTLIDAALASAVYSRTVRSAAGTDNLPEPPSLFTVDDLLPVGGATASGEPADMPASSSSGAKGVLPARCSHDDALIMYTSGTTGRPKGVVLSHQNLLAGGANVALGHALTARDRALCVLPLFHINGLCVTLLAPLVSGGSVVLPPRFSASRFWSWCETATCTWFSVVPTQVSWLLHAEADVPKVSSLRFGRSASAPLAPEVHRGFEERFGVPLVETMGLTETAAQILSNPMPPASRRSGSPGLPVGCELRIVDASSSECAPDVEGEICIRGVSVMSRYYKDAEATRAAMTEDGWLLTGDLGRRDAEGFVYVTGRLKELIIKGGENIAPREIDEALLAHGDVIEAAAFGLPCKDYGERVEAAVVLTRSSLVDEAELLAACRKRLGSFKAPERVHVLAELPKGPSGKIQRRRVAELCPAASLPGA